MLIQITLDHARPPSGSVSVASGGEAPGVAAPTPFGGWLDLMAVLDGIVVAAGDEEDKLGAGAQAELREDV
ncbi:hypothetical protein [Knoellia subterranea]|uniref:Uncharacterized protein n=1 Tax=Knoellia subterranea KCTC 19937 TaxID=1385521 RepID=A0A0A0JJL0_9MICO|nr:hypothetical protein [Knoellia subterranea]KGN37283.1 hypothetical protein N803_14620 [Knoellia subterranea KCTC 19937]